MEANLSAVSSSSAEVKFVHSKGHRKILFALKVFQKTKHNLLHFMILFENVLYQNKARFCDKKLLHFDDWHLIRKS